MTAQGYNITNNQINNKNMATKIYLNSDSALVIEEASGIIINPPSNSLGAKSESGRIELYYALTGVKFKDYLISEISNASGTIYGSYSTLISAIGSFFVKASAASGGVTPVLTDAYTANGADDGNGNITGTTTFQLPSDVNLSYPVECIDGGLINLAFTVNPTTKLATFTTAPLAGNIYFKYYK